MSEADLKERIRSLETADRELLSKVSDMSVLMERLLVSTEQMQTVLTKQSDVDGKLHKLELRISRNEDTVKVGRWLAGVVIVSLVSLAVKLLSGV